MYKNLEYAFEVPDIKRLNVESELLYDNEF